MLKITNLITTSDTFMHGYQGIETYIEIQIEVD